MCNQLHRYFAVFWPTRRSWFDAPGTPANLAGSDNRYIQIVGPHLLQNLTPRIDPPQCKAMR